MRPAAALGMIGPHVRLGPLELPEPPLDERSPAPASRVWIALLYTAVVLSLSEYFFIPGSARRVGLASALAPIPEDLGAGLVWVASTLVFFLAIPIALVRLVHRAPLASVGYSPRGLLSHLPVYLGLYALMVPVLWWVSQRPDFTRLYPFVPTARESLTVLLVWEAAYAAQFVALEAFFRGYLLFTCARRWGWEAIPVMVVPYTMIHFHKPWLECLSAVGAGVILGALALRFRTFWGGALLHILVAVSMDVLAVWRLAG